MKITVKTEEQTKVFPSFKVFFKSDLKWRIGDNLRALKLWGIRQVCRFKGHVRAYDEYDPDGRHPFCSRCYRDLRVRPPRISPYLR